MDDLIQKLINLINNSLPNVIGDAIGGLVAAGILALLGYLYQRSQKKGDIVQKQEDSIIQPLNKQEALHNLPSRRSLLNRGKDLKLLSEAIKSRPSIVQIEGINGVGKSSLALEFAHIILEYTSKITLNNSKDPYCFNAIIWIALESQVDKLGFVLDTIPRVLEYPYISTLKVNDGIFELHKVLRQKRTLLIFNGVSSKDQDICKFIEGLPEPTKIIITTERLEIDSSVVSIHGLNETDSVKLLKHEAQLLGVPIIKSATDDDLKAICEIALGNPLLLKWVVGYSKRTGYAPSFIASKMRNAEGDAVQKVWGRLWSFLSKEAQLLLLIITNFVEDASAESLFFLADLTSIQFESAILELIDVHLLQVNKLDQNQEHTRYAVHTITKSFSLQRVYDNPELGQSLITKWIEYFVTYSEKFYQKGRTAESYIGMDVEILNLLKCAAICHELTLTKHDHQAAKSLLILIRTIGAFLWARGYWNENIQLSEWAIGAAKILSDWDSLSFSAYNAAWVAYWRNHDIILSEHYLMECSTAAYNNNSPDNHGLLSHIRGIIALGKKDYIQAEKFFLGAVENISRQTGFASKASVMLDLGHLYRFKGDIDQADLWMGQALKANNDAGDEEGASIVLSYIAEIRLKQERISEADKCFKDSLRLAENLKRPTTIARCKVGLAEIAYNQGSAEVAINFMGEALSIYRSYGMEFKEQEANRRIDLFRTAL